MDMGMALEMKQQSNMADLYWENCPNEILLMIFERMSVSTLATCLFVNSRWRGLGMHVLKRLNMWHEIVEQAIKQTQLYKLKIKQSLDWQQIYYNYVLWHNIEKASINLKLMHASNNVHKINTYRDNLIVVTRSHVTYYDVDTLVSKRTIEISCFDFLENDDMIVVAQESDRYFDVQMFKKTTPTDFNIDTNNAMVAGNVLLYKLAYKACYVLDHRNCLFLYSMEYPGWKIHFVARFYGAPNTSAFLHVYDGQVFLTLKCSSIYWANDNSKNFIKINQITPTLVKKPMSFYCALVHRFGFLFAVDYNSKEKLQFERSIQSADFVVQCSELSCVAQHGDMLFLGYKDGTIEIFMTRNLLKTRQLRRLHLHNFKADIEDLEIISIDVYEYESSQYLFVATSTAIFQILITYPNCEEFMWKEYPKMPEILLDVSTKYLL